MKCPQCGHTNDRVLDTREQKEGDLIRRRRECMACKTRFTTVESLVLTYPYVIKKDGRREPYNTEKIRHGIQAACQKRPISLQQIETMVERISHWALAKSDKEISSQDIGRRVMTELKRMDDVAYVRFASVYRTFQDVQEFVETLEDQDHEVIDNLNQLPLTPLSLAKDPEQKGPPHEKTVARTCVADSISN